MKSKILVLLAALAAVGYALFGYFFPEKSIDNLTKEERLALKKNVVVLGVDERAEDNDAGRSDTLFVVMFDTAKKNVSLLSIPRDTRVRIDKHGWDKINHAYAYGGRELTQKTVEQFLGLRIHNYVMVDFKGFKGLVDAIGGIDIDVEQDMYYYDSWDGFTIDLKKGRQHLDGETAIQYVRYRDEEGDIGRIRRQQHFIMAVYEKIASADMLLHIPGLGKQLMNMIKTDLPLGDMVDIGRALHSMVKNEGIVMATVPGTPEYIGGISYWLPDVRAMRGQIADMQGAQMSERYRAAAQLMAVEYARETERALQKDAAAAKEEEEKEDKEDAGENKDAKALSSEDKALARKKAREIKKAEKQAQAEAKKAAKEEAAAKRRAAKEAARSAAKESAAAKAAPAKQARKVGQQIVVRLVNCSGRPEAGNAAAAQLAGAGFVVLRGGSGEAAADTVVIATSNNGAVISRLSAIPFAHKMRITRDGAADCDGVIMLGQDYQ